MLDLEAQSNSHTCSNLLFPGGDTGRLRAQNQQRQPDQVQPVSQPRPDQASRKYSPWCALYAHRISAGTDDDLSMQGTVGERENLVPCVFVTRNHNQPNKKKPLPTGKEPTTVPSRGRQSLSNDVRPLSI